MSLMLYIVTTVFRSALKLLKYKHRTTDLRGLRKWSICIVIELWINSNGKGNTQIIMKILEFNGVIENAFLEFNL